MRRPSGTGGHDASLLSDAAILESLVSSEASQLTTEENVVLTSVHELIDALDDQRKAMIARLRSAKVTQIGWIDFAG